MRMASPPDADDTLLHELLAPPPLEDCRTALEFWRSRLAGLPRRRPIARREARAMVARWEVRLRAAEAAAVPAPLRWLRSARRMARRTALVTVVLIGGWILTVWLVLLIAIVALLD
jgi:hypothetical protein